MTALHEGLPFRHLRAGACSQATVACMPAGRHGLLWTAWDQTPFSWPQEQGVVQETCVEAGPVHWVQSTTSAQPSTLPAWTLARQRTRAAALRTAAVARRSSRASMCAACASAAAVSAAPSASRSLSSAADGSSPPAACHKRHCSEMARQTYSLPWRSSCQHEAMHFQLGQDPMKQAQPV